jgi:membrane protease YdiL (CAAX protease family)
LVDLHHLFIRKPLLSYFLLSYAFFWLFLILILVITSLLRIPLTSLTAWNMTLFGIIGSWMPTLAAVIVTGAGAGREGVRQLLSRYFHFRFALKWYLAALIPLAIALIAAGLYHLLGGLAPGNGGLSAGFWAGFFIFNLLQGPTGEEAGWRGFALPRLRDRHGRTKASLILGLLWDFWHLPLWLSGGMSGSNLLVYILAFSLGIISLTFIMTWVLNYAPNTLVPAVILHLCYNAGLNMLDTHGLGLVPTITMISTMSGLLLVIAIIIFLLGGFAEPEKP